MLFFGWSTHILVIKHLKEIRPRQEYFAIDIIVLPHTSFNCLCWVRRTLSSQFLSTQHFRNPFPFNQPKHRRMFWKCSPTANGFECPVWRIFGSVSGAFFLWDHQYKCVLEKYEVRLVCARINTIQETAWNKESTKTKDILLEQETAIKWNATDESKVQTRELHWKKMFLPKPLGLGRNKCPSLSITLFFMYLTQTKVQNIFIEPKPHLRNIYER